MQDSLFDGATIDSERDTDRLRKQMGRVRLVMEDGRWHTLYEIQERTGDPQASVSARLRDLRKPKFGAHTIERRYVTKGLWEYQMKVSE